MKKEKVINTETGEIFSTIAEAAKFLGFKRITLYHQLNGLRSNKTSMEYLDKEVEKPIVAIYKLTNPEGKIYIGASSNIERRKKQYQLVNNIKKQVRLYESMLQFGVDTHIFSIIEECNISELKEKERHYQDLYSAMGINGLNSRLTGTKTKRAIMSDKHKNNRLGRLHSSESKIKMSKAKTGKINNNSMKKIIDIVTGEIYNSLKEAANVLNMKNNTLSSQLCGKRKNKTNLTYI